MSWKQIETVLIYHKRNNKNRIASFDFDSTLVKSKSKKKRITSVDDLVLKNDNIPEILQKLSETGYQIVIFSNQKNILKDDNKLKDIKARFEKFYDLVGMKILTFIATDEDHYRKPHIGMWRLLREFYNPSKLSKTFYCGDAAGRKGDFAATDRAFAENISMRFLTPEEFFEKGKKEEMKYKYPDPKSFIRKITPTIKQLPREMVLLVGPPASGKTNFAEKYYPKYKIISQDKVGTKSKTLKYTKEYLEDDRNVVIDNTNSTISSRKDYIELAEKYGYVVSCHYFNFPYELSRHLNAYRVWTTRSNKNIPDVALRVYYKKHQPPTDKEKIDTIQTYDFIPNFKKSSEFLFRYE
jgi:bifunctional polynucleotide phosphatase/kinase